MGQTEVALDELARFAYTVGMMANLNFPGIYQILNLRNGKRYIGQAQNIRKRWQEHRRERNGRSRNNVPLYRAIRKYGLASFQFAVLERVEDIALLNVRESIWINIFQSFNPAKGYNVCKQAGTTRGYTHSPDSKETMRALFRDGKRNYTGHNNPFFNKHHSEEARGKISKARQDTSVKQSTKDKIRITLSAKALGSRPVRQINADNTFVRFPTIKAASAATGANQGSIVGCCKGKYGRKTAAGFRWEYDE